MDEEKRTPLRDDLDWLDDEEQALWQMMVTAIRNVECAMDSRIRQELGIDSFCYTLLIALSEEPDGRATSHRIKERLTWPSVRIRYVAEHLEGLDLATLNPGVDDDNFAVAITEKGTEALRRGAPIYIEAVREIALGRLDDNVVHQLRALLPEMIRASQRMMNGGNTNHEQN